MKRARKSTLGGSSIKRRDQVFQRSNSAFGNRIGIWLLRTPMRDPRYLGQPEKSPISYSLWKKTPTHWSPHTAMNQDVHSILQLL